MQQGRSLLRDGVSRALDPFLHLPSGIRRLFVSAVFLVELAVATFLAFNVRFEGMVPAEFVSLGLSAFGYVAAVYLACYFLVGAHRGLWSFTGIHDFIKIPVVAFTGGVGSYVLIHQILAWTNYPRSIYILTAVFLFVLMSVNRGGVRLFRQWFQGLGQHGTPVVIVGAGRAGEMLVRPRRLPPAFRAYPGLETTAGTIALRRD